LIICRDFFYSLFATPQFCVFVAK